MIGETPITGAVEVFVLNSWKGSNPKAGLSAKAAMPAEFSYRPERGTLAYFPGRWNPPECEKVPALPAGGDTGRAELGIQTSSDPHPEALDPLYLFGCFVEWEVKAEPTSAWELISAALCSHEDTRAHARAFLASSVRMAARGGAGACGQIHRD